MQRRDRLGTDVRIFTAELAPARPWPPRGCGVAACGLCSASTVADHTPTALGGLPEGVPQRPTKPPAYPAVHDMPPARDSAVLSDAEQTKLEADLAKARDRLGAQSGPADKPAGGAPNP
jgi:hypothetical protein